MSHVTDMITYDISYDKRTIQAECDEIAANEGWREGSSGLPCNIRFIDHVCDTYKEAEEYIKSHDKGNYDQLAVKYMDTSALKIDSAKLQRLKKQVNAYIDKVNEYDKKHSLANHKSEFISCPHCKSKLARAFLRGEGCPVCGQRDIRAEYIKEQINKYWDKINSLRADIVDEEEAIRKKLVKKARVKWLVKIEYHV